MNNIEEYEEKLENLRKEILNLEKKLENFRVTDYTIFKDIIDNLGIGLGFYTMDGILTILNKTATEKLGGDTNDYIGKHYHDIYSKEISDIIEDRFNHLIKTDECATYIDEIELSTGSRWFSSNYKLIKDRFLKNIGIQIVSTDITNIKEAEEREIQTQKLESLGRMVSGIAHDFNNMLTIILGYSEILRNKFPNTESIERDYIDKIFSQTKKAAAFTGQLLNFVRKEKFDPITLDIQKLIIDTIEISKRIINKNLIINKKFEANKYFIEGDRNQLQNSFLNLILNANDAMPDGGILTILTKNVKFNENYTNKYSNISTGEYIEIEFIDTGIGMDNNVIDHIFEPFFTTKKKNKGTGLGLANVYQVINKHKGGFNLITSPFKGTKMSIFIPIIKDYEKIKVEMDNKQELARDNRISRTILQSKKNTQEKILIVDDEKIIRLVLSEMLNDLNYNSISADSGEASIKLVIDKKEKIDLIFMDLMMPGIGGIETIKIIKKINPNIKIVVLSGYGEEIMVDKLRGLGISDYLKKPITIEQLRNIINKIFSD